MATNKRMRGISIHRSILIGSTATPLSPAERISSPPDHTHKWTIAVRSAASHPLPTINDPEVSTSALPLSTDITREESAAPAQGSAQTPAATSGVSTRGREHETDYHKMVGGKDDISHFIKRVQFKLHETYPQSNRSIDKAPFQVTETGWGEFDVQIKIIFVPESGEKPLTTYHRLKLHPWHPVAVQATENRVTVAEEEAMTDAAADDSTQAIVSDTAVAAGLIDQVEVEESVGDESEATMQVDIKQEDEEQSNMTAMAQAPMEAATAGSLSIKHPPVVHSWTYDEIVFPEPTEAFYEILLANPPTPLPTQSAQAFSDIAAYNNYQTSLTQLDDGSGPHGRDLNNESGVKPPHPLHNSSGALFDALSQEAVQAEAERFDQARHNAVHQLEETRRLLIEGERKLREGKFGNASRPAVAT
ncbi:hypothetical protein CBS101457_006383 [Exobasidium rhododendri]|nr:hypothetical protein CBS101457_006383 [Exobasidium rhododendri]